MSYVDEVLEVVKKKNADQPEFLQAVTEVLDSLRPVIDANEELYRKNAILEMCIRDRPWRMNLNILWKITVLRCGISRNMIRKQSGW